MDDSDRSRDEPSDHEDPGAGGDDAAASVTDPDDGGDTERERTPADEPTDGDEERPASDADRDVDVDEGTGTEDGEADEPDDGGTHEPADREDDDGDREDGDDEGDESDEADTEGEESDEADAEGEGPDVGDERTEAEADGEDADRPDESDEDGEDDQDGDEPFGGIEGPDTDEEMPLAAHIEEMMRRLAIVFLFGGLATLVVVTESTALINYFWNYHIPAPTENRPRLYGPLELPLTRLKVAGIAGVVVGLPAFVYQTYRFMKPGLYENERRYYLAAVPTSLVLGSVGVAFAHFLVLPAIFSYFTTYTEDAATIAFGLAETFNLIVVMLAFMAIVFQIPLFIMLAIMMNLVTREWLEDKRLIFWGAFLGIAFIFSPDPTGMAPIIVTLTMIVLYEGTLAVLRWTGN